MDYQAKTDWNYNDTVTEQDMNRIEAGLGDLHNRLDTEVRQEIVLQPGTQTITAKRDTPFQLTGITGRMLLNLEARTWGPNKSMAGLAGFQSTITLDSSKSVVGGGSVKITATTANTIADAVSTKPYQLKAGKKYVAVGHIYNESAKSVLLALQGTSVSTPVFTDKGKWITAYMKYSPSVDVNNTQIVARLNAAAAGNIAYADGLRIYEISDAEYTALDKMTVDQIAVKYPYTEGLAGVRNPYAIRWTNKDKTDVAAMLAFDTELLASPVITNDTDRDTLFLGVEGQYYKNAIWRKRALPGDLNWVISASLSGFKEIKIVGYESYSPSTVIPIKFDGTVMLNTVSNKADVASFDGAGNFYLTISATDSGWADGYSPTIDEFKAYMYGWKMYDGSTNANDGLGVYSRTDGLNKRWTPLTSFNGIDYSGNVSTVPSARPENLIPGGYRVSRPVSDYMIMYRRPAAIPEPITIEGALNLDQGDNFVETGTGLIVRDQVKPQFANGSYYYINGATMPSSSPTERVRSFLQIYKNGKIDKWDFLSTASFFEVLGFQQARIAADRFDPLASYSVSYFPVSFNPTVNFVGVYPENERAIFNDLIQNVQRVGRRVSVVENKKSDKDGKSWNYLTPLNGWSARLGFGFRIEGNRVWFRGILSNGTGSPLTELFRMPSVYATKRAFTVALGTYPNTSTNGIVGIDFFTDGRVQIINAGTGALTNISFEGFSYSID
ncbi:hypothetical protein [Paenibacillus wulumuqiensis]|uniref:hypothetical protein n=1 Tax=Paenibacillus wulumuqiensis TaxID=1567107 RepID=UPI000619E4DF|nr:hypothetical protein [Paenibacillus wulumuqiensis]